MGVSPTVFGLAARRSEARADFPAPLRVYQGQLPLFVTPKLSSQQQYYCHELKIRC